MTQTVFHSSVFGLLIALTFLVFSAEARSGNDLSASYSWKHLEIGGAGFVTGMVAHPTTPNLLYARTDVGGAYRWDEATKRWTQLLKADGVPNPQVHDYFVESIGISPSNDQVVYVAVGRFLDQPGRILKSVDRGQTWVDNGQDFAIAGNREYRQGAERLAVDPINDSIVYFGSRNTGLWRSQNSGASWSQIATSSVPIGDNGNDYHPIGVKFVLFDPSGDVRGGQTQRIYAGVAGSGMYMSNNGGQTWTNIYASTDSFYDAEVASDGTLYAAFEFGDLLKYTPSNGQWTTISPLGYGSAYASLAVDPFDPQRLFVAEGCDVGASLHRSTDGGASWETIEDEVADNGVRWVGQTDLGNGAPLCYASMLFDTTVRNRLWLPEGMGVWRSSDLFDDTLTWQFESKGIEELVSTDVVAPPGGKPVTAHWDRPIFYHGDPMGTSYNADLKPNERFSGAYDLDYSVSNPNFIVAAIADHRVFFCCEDEHAYDAGYSMDGGQTWQRFASYDSETHPYQLRFGNIAVASNDIDNLVWLPTFNQAVHFSKDRGATWTEVILPGTEGYYDENGYIGGSHMDYHLNRKVLVADKVLANTFYLFHQALGIFRTTDGGETWTAMNSDLTMGWGRSFFNNTLKAVPGEAGHLWYSTGKLDGESFPLFRSTNGGVNWTSFDNVIDVTAMGFGKAAAGSSYPTLYIAGKVDGEVGIWRTIDEGATWDKVTNYPLGLYHEVTAIDGDEDVFGRIYLTYEGNSAVVGSLNSSPLAVTVDRLAVVSLQNSSIKFLLMMVLILTLTLGARRVMRNESV